MNMATTASLQNEIYSQLAINMEARAVQRIMDDWEPQLKKHCARYSELINEAWQSIQDSMCCFNKQKAIVLATMRQVEGEKRSELVIMAGLGNMIPQKYQEIVETLGARDDRSFDQHLLEPVRSHQMAGALGGVVASNIAPKTSPTSFSSSKPSESATSSKPPAAARSPPSWPSKSGNTNRDKCFMMKRTGAPLNQPAAKKAKIGNEPRTPTVPEHRELLGWEVEGQEYIFTYPPLGSGWFVVRCSHGPNTPPTRFKAHPLEMDLAFEHFNNNKACKWHDTNRTYDKAEIMRNFAYRVKSPEVNEEWVRAANTRLAAEVAKTMPPKNGGRAKGKQPEFTPSNRTLHKSPRMAPEPSMFVDDDVDSLFC